MLTNMEMQKKIARSLTLEAGDVLISITADGTEYYNYITDATDTADEYDATLLIDAKTGITYGEYHSLEHLQLHVNQGFIINVAGDTEAVIDIIEGNDVMDALRLQRAINANKDRGL